MFTRHKRIEPGPGQQVSDRLRVIFAGEMVAKTTAAYRVLETSHPPVYYFPPSDVQQDLMAPAEGRSLCEFKGAAQYWTLEVGGVRSERAAWSYPEPSQGFRAIKDFFAFYASRVDSCWVGDERVQAQAGDFYGGWITARILGPFKGGPGTFGW